MSHNPSCMRLVCTRVYISRCWGLTNITRRRANPPQSEKRGEREKEEQKIHIILSRKCEGKRARDTPAAAPHEHIVLYSSGSALFFPAAGREHRVSVCLVLCPCRPVVKYLSERLGPRVRDNGRLVIFLSARRYSLSLARP